MQRLAGFLGGILVAMVGTWAPPSHAAPVERAPRGDKDPPIVTVTPDDSALILSPNLSGVVVFVISTSQYGGDNYALEPVCSGAIVGCGPSSTRMISASGTAYVTVPYQTGAAGTSGTIKLRVSKFWGNAVDSGTYVVNVRDVSGVWVSPMNPNVVVGPSATAAAMFQVTNSSPAMATYVLTTRCTVLGVAGCNAPGSVTVAAGATAEVIVTYSAQSWQSSSGLVSLTATHNGVSSTGTVTVTVATAQGIGMEVMTVNSDATVARDQCLVAAAGHDGAYECGDLRLTHPLPTVYTKGKARTPTLLYNSQTAHPRPVVAANITLPTVPDSVTVLLGVHGLIRAQHTWPGSEWTVGAPRRVTLSFDASSDETGVYPYSVVVKSKTGGVIHSTYLGGWLIIVNRTQSPFGRGWWLAGHEQFVPQPDAYCLLLVQGDGSARCYYATQVNGVLRADSLDRPDTVKSVDGRIVRYAEHGVRVVFDAALRHAATINRLGDTTRFTYRPDVMVPDTLFVPPSAARVRYRFSYDENGLLTSVSAQSLGVSRPVNIGHELGDNRITAIADPWITVTDSIVRFTYVTGTGRIARRINKRGHISAYGYNAAGKLVVDSILMSGGTAPIVTTYRPQETQGHAGTSSVPLSQLATRIDGPRDNGDTTLFRLNRWGAPTVIINALGDSTVLRRENPRYPALVTTVRAPNGFTTVAQHDARGNISQLTQINPFGTGENAVTYYEWDPKWDFVTRITAPMQEVTMFAYDSITGNRLWQQVGDSPARRVTFRYGNAFKLVSSVQHPLSIPDSIEYDTLGNWSANVVDTNVRILAFRNNVGQIETLIEPFDVSVGGRVITQSFYDSWGRLVSEAKSGSSLTGTPSFQQIVVTRFYDPDGNLDSLQRSQIPDITNLGVATTRWRYDMADRVVAEVSPDFKVDSTVYDPAGNITTSVTRRGHIITMQYDRLNRLIKKVLPAVTYQPWTPSGLLFGLWYQQPPTVTTHDNQRNFPLYPNDGLNYRIPADTAVFTYDVNGNVLAADNLDAKIRRRYYPNGSLATDTLQIRTINGVDSTQHVYGLRFAYDLNGRRSRIWHPSILLPPDISSSSNSYGYNEITGMLESVYDFAGNYIQYSYDYEGRQELRIGPTYTGERRHYDSRGRWIRQEVWNNSGLQGDTAHQSPTLIDSRFSYNDRGQLTRIEGSAGRRDTVSYQYTGMGALAQTNYTRQVFFQGEDTPSGRVVSAQLIGSDPLSSRTVSSMRASTTLDDTHGSYAKRRADTMTAYYEPETGRILSSRSRGYYATYFDSTVNTYDFAGNLSTVAGGFPSWTMHATAYYYAADNKLRAIDARSDPTWMRNVAFEEFRYDALGRRVLVRARRSCSALAIADEHSDNARCMPSKVRRTVWDGSQELWEIQSLGGDTASAGALENDTDPIGTRGPHWIDNSMTYGRVAYTHGTELDRPAAVIRMAYGHIFSAGDHNARRYVGWPTFTLIPHWDIRGYAEFGSFGTGSRTSCKVDNGDKECVLHPWESGWPDLFIRIGDRDIWHGTLLKDKRDDGGVLFRRNRYYDPMTGRFTQEDPIGLAGGLNLYGYANGDPVNYSDPFGLCTIRQRLCHWIEATSMALGSLGGFVIGGGGPALTGVGVVASPFTAVAGAAAGAGIGLTAGKAITDAFFSEGVSGSRSSGSESNTSKLQRRLDEHRQKLDNYRRDPDAFDNQGLLRNAPSEEVRNRIIQGRIRHLETEIRAFEKSIRNAGGIPR